MTDNMEIDSNLLLDFIDESLDGLNTAEDLIVKLETCPDNMDIIGSVFRPVHSLKGSAAFFGLMKIKELAHALENLLDEIRRNAIRITKPVLDTLLSGTDTLRDMLSRVREGADECDDHELLSGLVSEISAHLAAGPSVKEYPDESLRKIRAHLVRLGHQLDEQHHFLVDEAIEILDKIITNKEETQADSKNLPETTCSLDKRFLELSDLIESWDNSSVHDADFISAVDSSIKNIENMTECDDFSASAGEIRNIFNAFAFSPVGFDQIAKEMINEKLIQMTEVVSKMTPAMQSSDNADYKSVCPEPLYTAEITGSTGASDAEADEKQAAAARGRTMRIAERSLDVFLDHVGELMVIEEMFRHLSRRLLTGNPGERFSGEMKQVVDQFGKLSTSLRESIMEIRKVEAKSLLQKVPRLVRDVSSATGKQISVTCIGDDVLIDKSHLDILDAPLTHMVRNAADHGIEPSETRVQTGKSPEGKICVEISETETELHLVISDDGKGLDLDALSRKAVQLGVFDNARRFSESDAVNLVFHSGVSTADRITDISGRGVGMDVVKKQIESAGGKISIKSTKGEGCVFRVALPRNVSTRITDGYLIRDACGEIYVIPLKSVIEAFVAPEGDISSVMDSGLAVKRRGTILPLVLFDRKIGSCMFLSAGKKLCDELQGRIILHINALGKSFAMMVNDVIGVQKIVIKPVLWSEKDNSLFDGAAVMGNGTVAMVISENCLAGFV